MPKGIASSLFTNILTISLLCSWLASCGSGGTTASSSSVSPAASNGPKVTGIDGTGGELPGDVTKVTSIGAITTDDGIMVNGVIFDTTNTNVLINGQDASGLQLSEGQIVTVNGQLSENSSATGSASSIEYATTLRGLIQAIDANEQTLTVLQQTIRLDDGPIFNDGDALETLVVGDLIEISAFKKENNELSASRIDKVATQERIISGNVSLLNSSALTFTINGQIIDYSNVIAIEQLANGIDVSVSGDTMTNDTLVAKQISITASAISADSNRVEVEGFPANIQDKFNFTVNGIQVLSRYAVEYIGGDEDDLNENSKIEVEGSVNADGVLEAERIIYLTAKIISHESNQKLSSIETFIWNDVGADEYRLQAISFFSTRTVFHDEFYVKGTTSATVNNLPRNSATAAIVLSTRHGSRWTQRVHRYFGSGELEDARLTSHKWNDRLDGTTATFTWNDVNADNYRLRITNIDTIYDEIVDGDTTSITVEDLPDNSASISVFLYTNHGGWSQEHRYNIHSVSLIPNGELTSHSNGEVLSTTSTRLTWTDVGAQEYRIRVKNDNYLLYDQTVGGNTTYLNVSDLPRNGASIDIKILTKHKGWAPKDYHLIGMETLPPSTLQYPAEDEVLQDSEPTFIWSPSPEAEAYRILVHRSKNAKEVYFDKKFDADVNQAVITGLPTNGEPLYIKVSTLQDGFWVHTGSTVQTTVK